MAEYQLNKLFKSIEFKILACDFHTADSWWNFKRVNSPFSRLYFITDGEAFVTHNGIQHHLKKGMAHLIPCFTFCDFYCPEKFSHYHISFVSRIAGDVDIFSFLKCDYSYQAEKQVEMYFKRIYDLYPECRLYELNPYRQLKKELAMAISQRTDGENNLSLFFESGGIMRLLLAPFLLNTQSYPEPEGNEKRWLQSVLSYIETNLGQEISLRNLAEVASLHPTYFSDLFKRVTGIRPMAYLTEKRINRSQILLASTKKSIKEIAYECGFSSVSYFNRIFKKVVHSTPGEFKKSVHS